MTSFYEQSDEEEIGPAIFSYLSHTAGKQEERRKTDRKVGKERRKASTSLKKTMRFAESPVVLVEKIPSINTIWCIGRNGHWGTPMLDDGGCLSVDNFCADCKHAEDKQVKWLKSPEGLAWEAEQDMLDRLRYSSAMWEDDYIEALEEMRLWDEQQRMQDEQQRLWDEQMLARVEMLERLLCATATSAKEVLSTEDPIDDNISEIDDYIPEIDDNFDD